MKKNLKEVIVIALIVIVTFVMSFFECNGIYFVMNIPVIMYLVSCQKFYPFYSLIGMLLAAVIIDINTLPLVVLAGFFLGYLTIWVLRYLKLPIKLHLCLSASLSSLFLGSIYYFSSLTTTLVTIIVISLLAGLITNYLIDIQYDLKMKENISITKKQLAFSGVFLSLLLSQLYLPYTTFYLGFVVMFVLSYILTRVDPLIGILSCVVQFALLAYQNSPLSLLTLIPMIFGYKFFNRQSYLKIILIPILFVGVSMYFNSYILIDELVLITLLISCINNDAITDIHKYIIEPQDYQLKLYQQSYYKCLNRNKKIQRAMELLEKQLSSNDNIKLRNKKIILYSMQYLSDKLKEEEDIKIKDNILNDLKTKKLSVLSLKIDADYFYNYNIYLEIKNDKTISENDVLDVLENYLNCKFKIKKTGYNNLLNIYKIYIINDQKLSFNFFVKQRSKDATSCGDSYINFDVKNKKYFLISDGMGHGKKANKESSAALLLLKEFIELGMDPQDAINVCNALILNKEKEIFNTLDLLEYDIYVNKIYIYKNGSGATYVRKNTTVEVITSENLPLGIVENIIVKKQEIDNDVDLIVLTSDGIKKDIKEVVVNAKSNNPKSVIDSIFQYEGEVIEDDQTIVAINVRKNS